MTNGLSLQPLQRRQRRQQQVLSFELCEERALLAVLDLMPGAAAGTITDENGTTVITVAPDQVIDLTAELESTETPITGYQINFGNSASSLVLANWTNNDKSFSLAVDSTLDHTQDDRFVAAIGFSGIPAPPTTALGTFQVSAPTTEGDYLLTLDFTTGGETENTILSDGLGNAVPITDFGNLIIRVQIPNDPPTISKVDDVTIDEDAMTGDLPFTVGDTESSADSLVVTASSDDQALVPDENIIIIGTGTHRTVKVTPLADQNGSAVITLVVSDGVKITEESFTVNVTPVNDAPTITAIDDTNIDEDTTTGDLAFTIGDLETSTDLLIVSASSDNQALVPDGNIVITGTEANRTVRVTPPANQYGSALITLVVSDGDKTTETAFALDVTPINDPPTGIQLSANTFDENVDAAVVASITVDDVDSADTYSFDISDNRFEIVNGDLKLKSGNVIDFEVEPEISVTIGATDSGNLFVEETFLLEVVNKNDMPEVNQTISEVIADLGDPAVSIDVSDVFRDQDIASMGDVLTVTVAQNSNPGVVTAAVIDNDLELEFSTISFGSSVITLRATDSQNDFVETSFQVTVKLDSSVSVKISSLSDSGAIGSVRTIDLTPKVLHEWQNAIAGIWVTVGDEIPTVPFDLTVQLDWSPLRYETAELIDFLGADAAVNTTLGQDAATSDVTLVGVDLSGYSIGENVLVGRVALNVDAEDLIGVPMDAAGVYPTLVEDIGFALNSAALVVDNVDLKTAPTPQVDLSPVIYDADDSGRVGISDFALFIRNYGRLTDGSNPDSYRFDYDRSGRVGISDFALLIQHYSRSKPNDRFVNMPGLTSPLSGASASPLLEGEPDGDLAPSTSNLPATPASGAANENTIFILPVSPLEDRSAGAAISDKDLQPLRYRVDDEHASLEVDADQFFQVYEHVLNAEFELIEHYVDEECVFPDVLDESLKDFWEE
ncbi:hypothetical protein Pan97_27010 [Bremerella volcania]|uniref:Cadherin domain protein n=1 Tax=Bremerella volcania TaxID=2527984 RepID=A0A518C8W8_9BACT|nr:Ig-like domain-containing protein [Bremerella volcania]QDU75667.1 hypothetical protein Pan97_27010 [Bremerella volcania]